MISAVDIVKGRDLTIAEQALSQITAAFEVFRNAGHAPAADEYRAQLPRARALVERLRQGQGLYLLEAFSAGWQSI